MVSSGAYTFGSDSGRLWLLTGRQGLASAAGHDLHIDVTRWSGVAEIDANEPELSHVRATIDATSFVVRDGTGGVKPLTDHDRQSIQSTVGKTLSVARYPTISFVSTAVAVPGAAVRVRGDLTIRDISRAIEVDAELSTDESLLFVGGATVVQSNWNIAPYKGFLGTLKVADPVTVRFDFALA